MPAVSGVLDPLRKGNRILRPARSRVDLVDGHLDVDIGREAAHVADAHADGVHAHVGPLRRAGEGAERTDGDPRRAGNLGERQRVARIRILREGSEVRRVGALLGAVRQYDRVGVQKGGSFKFVTVMMTSTSAVPPF